jgi:large subunit ribosomal protein L22
MAQDVIAKLNNIGISAQKTRLVVNLVRGKSVNEALNILKFTNKVSAEPIYKLIASAAANAEENFGLDRNDMYVHTIYCDEAATRRWRYFGARGRFKPIFRRTSHVTVVLRERE